MFVEALKAGLPIIAVHTDDLVNLPKVLQSIAEKKASKLASSGILALASDIIYWTDNEEAVTVDLYQKLKSGEKQLIVVNPEKSNSLMRDVGQLPTPTAMIESYLIEASIPEEEIQSIMDVLKGLSLKTASEVVQLTQVINGDTLPENLRRTRILLGADIQGLYTVDTEVEFYIQPKQLTEWLDLNKAYYLNRNTPPKLRPRGLMLAGAPGVGKSMAAKAIANYFKVPLFRLDIATTMDKYVGVSEGRVARSLTLIEKESPCVMLLDEVEKIFGNLDDQGVTSRILSQLLWWLSEHKSKVLTIMTTNNIEAIPPELYRTGRVDQVMTIEKLSLSQSKEFAILVFQSVTGTQPTLKQQSMMRGGIDNLEVANMSHVEVAELVYTLIKKYEWIPLDKS